jgi:hypothetical protein
MTMAKKVKTFTVDAESYDALVALFKEHKGEASVSYCLDRYIKEMLGYLQAIKKGLAESTAYTVSFAFIMEAAANAPKFKNLTKESGAGDTASSVKTELDEWQKTYDEQVRESLKLTVDRKVFDQINEAAKAYGVTDVMTFFFRVKLEETKKGRELTGDEYRAVVEAMGEGFDEFRKKKVVPAFDRIDQALDKALKPFGLKVDKEENK